MTEQSSSPGPLTSIVMVSYHTGSVLFDAIAAVLAQTAPVELVLVNNGNPPETEARLAAMAKAEPRLKFMTGHGNIGFGRGCNRGERQARGDYLLLLNPDSVLTPEITGRLIEEAARHPRPALYGVLVVGQDGKEQRACRRALLTPKTALIEALGLYRLPSFKHHRLNFLDQPLPENPTKIPAISGSFMFMHRNDFKKIGGFDEKFFLHVEDLDFCLRFTRAGGAIWFLPHIKVLHHGSTSDVTSRFIEWQKAKGFMRYFHKNYPEPHNLPLVLLIDLATLARFVMRLIFRR